MYEFYGDKGIWPSTASEVMGNTAGKYVSAVTIVAGGGSSSALSLEARIKDVGVNTAITGGTLILTSLDGRIWDCTTGTLASKFRPASCRP
jgi:hypothetical protein